MATLLEALSNGTYDLQNKRDLSGDFAKKLIDYRNAVVSDFLKFNINLNKAISKIAKKENLNDDQIQRIVEEVNNQVYLIKYDKTRGSNEREVEFDIASVEGVKKELKGDSNSSKGTNNENAEDKNISKSAFEKERLDTFEKVASVTETKSSELFTGLFSHKFGDLSSSPSLSKDEYALQKIAQLTDEKEKELNKIMSDVSYKTSELADVFINLEKLGSDAGEVLGALVKKANLNLNEVNMIKDCINNKIELEKTAGCIPPSFKVSFENVSLEGEPKFSLGKYSLEKKASVNCNIPGMILSSKRSISSFDGILKLAQEFKDNVKKLEDSNEEYLRIREKCAEYNIDSDILEDALYSPSLVNVDGLVDSLEKQAADKNIASATIQKLKDAISSRKGVVGTLIGNEKREAKKALSNARNARDAVENSPMAQNLKNKLNSLDQRAEDVVNAYKNNVKNLKQDKDVFLTRNRAVVERANSQGRLRNLFDKDVRNVKKELKGFDKKIKSESNAINNNRYLDNISKEKDNAIADLKQYYNKNDINKLDDDVEKATEMYRKAVRKTNITRGAVGAVGAGAYGLDRKIKNDRLKRQQAQIAQQMDEQTQEDNNQNFPQFGQPMM